MVEIIIIIGWIIGIFALFGIAINLLLVIVCVVADYIDKLKNKE